MSPDASALLSDRCAAAFVVARSNETASFRIAAVESGDRAGNGEEPDPCAGWEAEIEAEFRRRVAGLQRMRPRDRIAARQAAKSWRAAAQRTLRARRATARQARKDRRIWRAADWRP